MSKIHFDLVQSGELAETDALPLPCDYFDLIGGTSTGGYVIPTLLCCSFSSYNPNEKFNCVDARPSPDVSR